VVTGTTHHGSIVSETTLGVGMATGTGLENDLTATQGRILKNTALPVSDMSHGQRKKKPKPKTINYSLN
jgi:hypothetical protein